MKKGQKKLKKQRSDGGSGPETLAIQPPGPFMLQAQLQQILKTEFIDAPGFSWQAKSDGV